MNLKSLRSTMTNIKENGLFDQFGDQIKSFRFGKKQVQASIVALGMVGLTAFSVVYSNNLAEEDLEAQAYVDESQVVEVAESASDAEWANKLMADVDESLAIRQEASTESACVGKLRKGDLAEVTETLDGWYKIKSGSVEGYVKAEYCCVGDAAKALSEEDCTVYATSKTDGLRVRATADENGKILTVLNNKGQLAVSKDTTAPEGWVAVTYNGQVGYIKSEYVDVATYYSTAISAAEEAAAKKAQAAAAAAKTQSTVTTTTQKAAIAASYDETTILAALIQHEAGSGSYEGKVAVGAVVMNRVRSGGYPSTIVGVINQSGQFGSGTAALKTILAKGPSSSCMQAAQAAISGVDNTGGALQFRSASSGHAGTVIGGNVFF